MYVLATGILRVSETQGHLMRFSLGVMPAESWPAAFPYLTLSMQAQWKEVEIMQGNYGTPPNCELWCQVIFSLSSDFLVSVDNSKP